MFYLERKKIANQPYNFRELIQFFRNHLFGPSKKYSNLVDPLPKKYSNKRVCKKLELCFVGDIMPSYGKDVYFGEKIRDFINGVDFLIGNFEGVLGTGKGRFIKLIHSQKTLDNLTEILPPSQIVLMCANNHSCDLGVEPFEKSYQLLQDLGFRTIGHIDEPFIELTTNVGLSNVTFWSNRYCESIASKKSISRIENITEFNILSPHWGFELTLYPHPKQISLAKELLKNFDLIIGHHSHTPQPITKYSIQEKEKFVAYSLGNFVFGKKSLKHHHTGIILKVVLGKNENSLWDIGMLSWEFTKMSFQKEDKMTIEIVEKDYFLECFS